MAIAWTTITRADLIAYKTELFVSQMEQTALGEGQADPIPQLMVEAIQRIRMEIAAGGRTVLSRTENTVPPSLKSIAVRIALRMGQSRLNAVSALPLSDDERKEWDYDEKFLSRIAKGEITVEDPLDPQGSPDVQATSMSPSISARIRRFSRSQQEGI